MVLKLRQRNVDAHVQALEGIVSANTFFTVAVLIGITGTITPSPSIPPFCLAGDDIARNLFLFEILSFGLYLLSSLLAQGTKLAVTLLATDKYIKDNQEQEDDFLYEMRRENMLWFARWMMLLAAFFTILGTLFLLLSMVDAIQLKFGLFSCNIPLVVNTTLVLFALVSSGIVYYILALLYALKQREM